MIIYIDILLCSNIIINYLLLLLTAKYSSIKPKKIPILISSTIGGVYSFISLFPNLSLISILIFKLLFCFIMVLITFEGKDIIRNYIITLTFNFIFSGLMLILWVFVTPKGMNFNNGIVYFNISTTVLIISTLSAYILISLFTLFAKKVPIEIKSYNIFITINNKNINLKGFVDTGNFLQDFFSSTPVVICNYDSIKQILPIEIQNLILLENKIPSQASFSSLKLRFIPCQTISGEKLIIAIRPDKFILKTDNSNKTININDVYIGISTFHKIDKNYDIILNPSLLKNNSLTQTFKK